MDHHITNPNQAPAATPKQMDIPQMTERLLDTTFYLHLYDEIDRHGDSDYSLFNDLEMMYLHVHKRKSLKADDERRDNTKKEMIRDLLIFYNQLIDHHQTFEIPDQNMNVDNLLKGLTERNIRKYEEWIGTAPLGKGGRPYSKATLSKKTVIIRGFFAFLYEAGYISVPLHNKMRSSSVRDKDRPDRDMSTTEVEAILTHYRDHPIIYPLILTLATTGLRVQELCTSRVCDLSLSNGEYWLKVIGKGRKKREVLIHRPVYEEICRFRKWRGLGLQIDATNQGPLFVTAKNKAYGFKYLSNYLIKKMNQVPADIIQGRSQSIAVHSLRHYYASHSAELGVSLLRIQQSLGHADPKTTMIYIEKTLARKNHASHAWSDSSLLKGRS